jgi:hypothetical protein
MNWLFVRTSDGKKKAGVGVYIIFLVLGLSGALILINQQEENKNKENKKQEKNDKNKKTQYLSKEETTKTKGSSMDAETLNALELQLAKEKKENNGYLPKEREAAIRKKYEKLYEEKQSANFRPNVNNRVSNFNEKNKATTKPVEKVEEKDRFTPDRYMTFAERLAAEGNKNTSASASNKNEGIDLKTSPNALGLVQPVIKPITPVTPVTKKTEEWAKVKNFLPLGTFIPCVLDGDIITTDLQQKVWANVVLDSTFRRQLQLPQGIVKVRGSTAKEPVQNKVDVVFDTMLFSDGTEMPIEGFAYAAFDLQYPDRFKTRGIQGELIVPPKYVEVLNFVYAAAGGAADGYAAAYQQGLTQTNIVGGMSTTTQSQPNPGKLALATAAQASVAQFIEQAKADLQKYKPYVVVSKGSPFYIQLDKTINLEARRVNGTELAKIEAEAEALAMGKNLPNLREIYAPGDARAKYTGVNGSTDSPIEVNPQEQLQKLLTKSLESNSGLLAPGTTGNPRMPTQTGTPNATNVDALKSLLQAIQK